MAKDASKRPPPGRGAFLARHPAWGLGLLVGGLAGVVFRQAALFGDDVAFLERYLPSLQSLQEAWHLPPAFRDWFGPLHRPLSILSWQADRAWWGSAYAGHHLSQALYYALTVAAFTALCGALLSWWRPELEERRRRISTWWAGALFAFHPLHVETAAWLATRHDVLYGGLLLWGWVAALRALQARGTAAAWRWSAAAALCGFLSVQAKESGYAFLPGVAALLLLEARRGGSAALRRRAVVLLAPSAASLAACLAFRATVAAEPWQISAAEAGTRWLSACGWAFTNTLLPVRPRVFHDPPPPLLWAIPALVAAVVWAAAGVARLRRRRDPLPFFGFLVFGLTLASTWTVAWYPFLTTVVADRYLFLPVGGAILAVAGLLAAPAGAARAVRWAVLLGFVAVSGRYALAWGPPARDLGLYLAKAAPASLQARIGGVARALRDGDLAGARAIHDLEPQPLEGPREAGRSSALDAMLLAHEGRWPEAVTAAIRAVQADREDGGRWFDLGLLRWQWYLAQGEETPPEQRLEQMLAPGEAAMREALARDARHFRAHLYLGKILVNKARMGAALDASAAKVGEIYREAADHFRQALRYGRGSAEARWALDDLQWVVLQLAGQ